MVKEMNILLSALGCFTDFQNPRNKMGESIIQSLCVVKILVLRGPLRIDVGFEFDEIRLLVIGRECNVVDIE